jgi:hypothetical protein
MAGDSSSKDGKDLPFRADTCRLNYNGSTGSNGTILLKNSLHGA